MKTIHYIYKYALAVLLALVGGVNAWGQVEGNQYQDTYMINLDVSLVSSTGDNTNGHPASSAVDNDASTWWQTKGETQTAVLVVDLGANHESVQSLYFNLGGDENARATSISVESSNNSNGNRWTDVATISNTSRERYITSNLNNAITARYVRLTFSMGGYGDHTYVVDDVFFQSGPHSLTGATVKHKRSKWFDMREGKNFVDAYNQSLGDADMITSGDGTTEIQTAHTYIDTLYVRKGEPIELWLPTISRSKGQNSAQKYQRWYNYLTEGTFSTGNSGSDQVQDLLTPDVGDHTDVTAYRFTNGYVAGYDLMGSSDIMYGATFYYPTDNQFSGINNGDAGNDYYVVACDISGYTDFTDDFVSGAGGTFSTSYMEPTLSLRVIYYIVGIGDNWEASYPNDYQRLNTDAAYKGGTNASDKKYLEEYEINFPSWHIGNFTDELVSLAREAQHYRIPGDKNSTLKVSFAEGGDTFTFLSNVFDGNEVTNKILDGDQRIISFRKKNAGKKSPWHVDNGTTATILVTKTVGTTIYNIARYKLTFRDNIRLLTQHQIDRLDDARTNAQTLSTLRREDWFKASYLYRTPKYLEGNYILLTSRTFDYDKSVVDYGQQHDGSYWYYPYPLDWGFSSYAFYDGSTTSDFDGSTKNNPSYERQPFVEWGSYAITDQYIGYGDLVANSVNSPTNPSLGGRNADGYFLYVDASNRPGQLVTLPFTEKLCAGSELLVSAWVKSAGTTREYNSDGNQEDYNDAAMLFTIYGVDEKGNRTAIYSQSTSQIKTTTVLTTSSGEEYTNVNGYDSRQNDWYHVFFSFVNDDEQVADYVSYELKVDNNCGSTGGGDYYLDDIKVYIAKPLAQVQQLETACTTGRTLMNLQLDWDRLMARVGDENTGSTHNLAVCFIDTLAFHNAYNTNGENVVEAIKASAVDLGQEGQSYSFRVLNYNTTFSKNTPYDEDNVGGNLAADNNDAFYGYTMGEDDLQALSVDFYGSLTPGRAYWIVLVPKVFESDINTEEIETEDGQIVEIRTVSPSLFFSFYTDPCAITADFLVTGNTTIKVDGEIVTPETEFCRGNVSNFTIELKIPDVQNTGDSITITDGIYFDWFFGEEREGQISDPRWQYTEKVSVVNGQLQADATNGVSMEEALVAFRNAYPNATDLSTTDTPVTTEFTQAMYNLIDYYLHTATAPEGALNRTLVLHQSSLNITLLETLRVVVQPIPMSISTEDLENWGYGEEDWLKLCWGYTYLELTTTNEAPSVYPGFNTVQYPDAEDLTNQSLRIGLKQIESVSTSNNNTKTLTIDLREAKSYQENNQNFELQLIGGDQDPDDTYNKLFLIGTDDPNMYHYIEMQGTDFDSRSLPIGVIKDFEAHYYREGPATTNNMEVQFILDEQNLTINGTSQKFTFIPREGYYYTFRVYFEEQSLSGSMTACFGRFPLTMKVVPEYLVWNDTQKDDDEGIIGNWNNDSNWLRATNTDIKATSTITDYNNDNRAFVPMLFSKVIMPRNSKVQLYAAGYGENGKWNNRARPDNIAEPTPNIQYDLMAFEHTGETAGDAGVQAGDLKTERYRVSLLNQIHFEPGAEMLHAEYLLYDTAWVDYQLTGSRWYTLASPLQGVVAGDFYTDSRTGQEGSEYFKDIKFNTEDDDNIENNSRFNPSVYQRGWKGNATLVTAGNNTNGTSKEVAVAGNWSALYNDVTEAYTPGTGFSLKVQDLPTGSDDGKALFRLPKADPSYSYYSQGSTQPGGPVGITRYKPGRLRSDTLFTRNTDMTDAQKGENIVVQLDNSYDGTYYLVGNPFMAHLDMKKFFESSANEGISSTYWVVNDGNQSAGVGESEGDGLVTTGDGTIAPLQSFFIKKDDSQGATTVSSVTFTADMQVLGRGSDDGLRSANALMITATTDDGRQSRAAVAYSGMASDDYQSGEDAELFLDSNLGDVPMVYTVAGTMATSINVRQNCELVPLGVYGTDDEPVTLRFDQVDAFSGVKLYDAQTKRYTTLTEGSEVSVSTNDSGRYYLTGGLATGSEAIRTVDDISIYSVRPGEIVATSAGSSLRSVRVYGIGGELVTQQSLANQSVYRLRVPGNAIYVVYAEDMDGIIRNVKLRVR